jgi:tripartite-type tricarboxylate transporter receptor subunit TctC
MVRWARVAGVAGVFAAAMVGSPESHAQDYPSKPVRIVVGFTPGGGADMAARLVAQKMNDAWKRQVLVDNRPGAGGNLASELVAKAPPDGHTLLLMPGPSAPGLYPKLGFDPRRDFTAVTLLGQSPNLLVVHPSVPVANARQLIALAKTHAGGLAYASSGVGIAPHLAAELFGKMAGVKLLHVMYKGAGPAVIDLAGGRVDMMIVSIPSVLGMVKANRLKVLAATSAKRSFVFPDLPTLAESALPGFEVYQWWSLMGPAGIPRDVLGRLHATAVAGLADPEIRRRFADEGADVVGNTPAEFDAFYRKELDKWDGVVAAAKITLQ